MSEPLIRSDVEGLHWPGLPNLPGAHILALLQQFEHSQWWPLETIRQRQRMQLESLLLHASASVPFYADRLARAGYLPDRPLSDEVWSAIAPLERSEVQAAGTALNSGRVPPNSRQHRQLEHLRLDRAAGNDSADGPGPPGTARFDHSKPSVARL